MFPPLAAPWDALAKDDVDERSINNFTGRLDNNLEEFMGNYLTEKSQKPPEMEIVEGWERITGNCAMSVCPVR